MNLGLTPDEQDHVRGALHFLRLRLGRWDTLASALKYKTWTLRNAVRRTITPALAFRTARLVKVPIDDLLAGKFPAPGTCPHCGHKATEE